MTYKFPGLKVSREQAFFMSVRRYLEEISLNVKTLKKNNDGNVDFCQCVQELNVFRPFSSGRKVLIKITNLSLKQII